MFPSTDPYALEVLELTLVQTILKPVESLMSKILQRREHFITKAHEYAERNGISKEGKFVFIYDAKKKVN